MYAHVCTHFYINMQQGKHKRMLRTVINEIISRYNLEISQIFISYCICTFIAV